MEVELHLVKDILRDNNHPATFIDNELDCIQKKIKNSTTVEKRRERGAILFVDRTTQANFSAFYVLRNPHSWRASSVEMGCSATS